MNDFVSPIKESSGSPLYQKMSIFSRKLVGVHEKMMNLSKTSRNTQLPSIISSSISTIKNSVFFEPSCEESFQRNRLINSENNDDNDGIENFLAAGNYSLFLHDFYSAILAYCHFLYNMNDEYSFDDAQKYLFAVTFLHFGSYQTSLNLLSSISDRLNEPYNCDAIFRMGIASLKLQKYADAIRLFNLIKNKKIPWISQNDIVVLQSHAYFLNDDLSNAISTIEKIDKLSPGVVQQKCFLYLFISDMKKIDKAIELLKYHEATKYSPYLQYLKGRLFYKHSQFREAFEPLSKAISMKEDEALFWCALGNLYFRASQTQEAALCYNKAIFYDPEMIEAWNNYGAMLELDSSLGDPKDFYATACKKGGIPIQREAMKRKKLLQSVKTALIPQIMEPNDRLRFEMPGEMIVNIYINEPPRFSPDLKNITQDQTLREEIFHNNFENAPLPNTVQQDQRNMDSQQFAENYGSAQQSSEFMPSQMFPQKEELPQIQQFQQFQLPQQIQQRQINQANQMPQIPHHIPISQSPHIQQIHQIHRLPQVGQTSQVSQQTQIPQSPQYIQQTQIMKTNQIPQSPTVHQNLQIPQMQSMFQPSQIQQPSQGLQQTQLYQQTQTPQSPHVVLQKQIPQTAQMLQMSKYDQIPQSPPLIQHGQKSHPSQASNSPPNIQTNPQISQVPQLLQPLPTYQQSQSPQTLQQVQIQQPIQRSQSPSLQQTLHLQYMQQIPQPPKISPPVQILQSPQVSQQDQIAQSSTSNQPTQLPWPNDLSQSHPQMQQNLQITQSSQVLQQDQISQSSQTIQQDQIPKSSPPNQHSQILQSSQTSQSPPQIQQNLQMPPLPQLLPPLQIHQQNYNTPIPQINKQEPILNSQQITMPSQAVQTSQISAHSQAQQMQAVPHVIHHQIHSFPMHQNETEKDDS